MALAAKQLPDPDHRADGIAEPHDDAFDIGLLTN
jgi:hypothetical protein